MATAKYINFNQGLPIGEDSTSIFSRIKSAGSNLNSTTLIIIVAVIEKSESYLKGLKLGDEIITIDKLNVNYYKTRIDELNQLRDNIKEIVISRNKESMKYNF